MMDTKNFIKYLEGKNLAPSTRHHYILVLKSFFKWAKKEDLQITKPDILRYLEYLKKKKGVQNVTRQNHLFALKHYFTMLYENDEICKNPCNFLKIRGTKVKKMHNIYTSEELSEIYDNFYNVFIRNFQTSKYFGKATEENIVLKRKRNLVALGIMLYQGTLASELKHIQLDDLDLQKGTLKISASKRAKERILPLNVAQIGALINFIENVKPKLEQTSRKQYYENMLFSTENQHFEADVLTFLIKNVRKIDKNFKNFYQVRTSVITNWLKINGLRRTQYLAGHRSIACTEKYLPNNLEDLIDDINKMHPFNL